MAKKLNSGDQAPDISAVDIFGKQTGFAKAKHEFMLVSFLRYAGCPWCNLAVHRLAMEQPILNDSKCDVLAIIQSDDETVESMIYDRHAKKPDFSIIADPKCLLYKKYRVEPDIKAMARSITKIPQWVHAVKEHGFKQGKLDGNLFMVPANFLVHIPSQTIVYANYGSSYYEHETFSKVYQAIYSY